MGLHVGNINRLTFKNTSVINSFISLMSPPNAPEPQYKAIMAQDTFPTHSHV